MVYINIPYKGFLNNALINFLMFQAFMPHALCTSAGSEKTGCSLKYIFFFLTKLSTTRKNER